MPTPQENAQILIEYWKSAALTSKQFEAFASSSGKLTGALGAAQQLARAMRTMKELISQATANPSVRITAFAGNGIFEQSILLEDGRLTGILLNAARAGQVDTFTLQALWNADHNLRTPRQIMLDGIYSAGTAGIFVIKDPSGMTSWLKSVHAAGIAILGAIKGDPDGAARAALLKLLRDVALPVELARALKTGRAFEALTELLPASPLSIDARRTIQVLGAEADARMTRDLAQLPDLGQLPAFPTGDGALASTLPPALAWYRRPGFWATGVLGILAGGAAAARAAR